ncbi:MAG: hypothetical protein GY708_00250 [Actinomycetia bacterium]|nr:hypothetical protein [Actinomycetes bacterium]
MPDANPLSTRTVILSAAVAASSLGLSAAVLSSAQADGGDAASATMNSESANSPTDPIHVTVEIPPADSASTTIAQSAEDVADVLSANATTVATPRPATVQQSSPTTQPRAPAAAEPADDDLEVDLPDESHPTTTAKQPAASKAPNTTAPPSTTTTTSVTEPPPTTVATEYLYYSFDGVASQIVLAVHGGTELEFWSVVPVAGWSYGVEESGNEVEIEFRTSGGEDHDEDDDDDEDGEEDEGGEAEFKARLTDGRVVVSKER